MSEIMIDHPNGAMTAHLHGPATLRDGRIESAEAVSTADKSNLWAARTRAEQVRVAQVEADRDDIFRQLVDAADQARDERNWGLAEFNYWQALERHPYQAGYRVQYAHMLKEQGKWMDAELHYRSAIALGEPVEDVRIHLSFVADHNGATHRVLQPALDVPAMLAAPSWPDIRLLTIVCLHREDLDIARSLEIMRTCKNNSDVMMTLIQSEDFCPCNMEFLDLLRTVL